MPINEHAEKTGLACSCLRLKHFYPFLGYLLPTVLVTYGIAIPRSCLAGLSAQSVGFGAAMIAAGIAYWLGIRLALSRRCWLAPESLDSFDYIPGQRS